MSKLNVTLIGILVVMFAAAGVYSYLGYSGNEVLSAHYMTDQEWSDSSCGGCHIGTYGEVAVSYHVEQDLNKWSTLIEHGVDVDSIDDETKVRELGQVQPGGGYMAEYGVDVDCMICHEQNGRYDFQARAESIGSGNFEEANMAAIEEAKAEAQKEGMYVASYMLDVLLPLPLVTEVHDEVNGAPSKALCGSNCHLSDVPMTGVTWAEENHADYDVHAEVDCAECHETEEHQIGRREVKNVPESMHELFAGEIKDCDSSGCHAGISHGGFVDGHLKAVSCETCHVPAIPGGEMLGGSTLMEFSWANGVREDVTHEDDFAPTVAWSEGIYYDQLPVRAEREEGSLLQPFNVITGIWWDAGINADVAANPDTSSAIGNPIAPADVSVADGNSDGEVTEEEMRAYDGNSDGQADYPNAVLRHVEMYYQVSHNIAGSEVGLADPLGCADCHGVTSTVIDWTALGYEGDPAATASPTKISVTIPGQKPTEVEREPAF
ncbi:methanogenesis multiheme c-type cytochrome [Methanolobus sp. ZRKC3]|uniref:methanogenesis multiheme c-type cytochrome n=1 Tax=Methanolobus sp. ZRKC3 TaxID=3125786 RepID=UPI00324B30AC